MLIIAIILLVNAGGFLLRYYELDPYVILMGFRFHLSLCLPVFFLLNDSYRQKAKHLLIHPGKFRYSALIIIFFSGIALFAALYFTGIIEFKDPEYFYELGLSSIIDFPMYLLLNLPQLLIFTLFLCAISYGRKAGYLIAFSVFILLFAYQFIPIDKEKFNFISAAELLSAALLFSLIIYKIRNIYLSSCLIFLSVWMFVLLSGSSVEQLVSLFLGRYYSSWEGFFAAADEWNKYIFFLYAGVQLILILAYIIINAYNIKAAKNTTQ